MGEMLTSQRQNFNLSNGSGSKESASERGMTAARTGRQLSQLSVRLHTCGDRTGDKEAAATAAISTGDDAERGEGAPQGTADTGDNDRGVQHLFDGCLPLTFDNYIFT